MDAKTVMTHEVKTVQPNASVSEIVNVLIGSRISAVPVVDGDGTLVGLVSEADLLHRTETGTETRRPWWVDLFADPDTKAEAFLKAHGRTADDVMTRHVVTIEPDTPLDVVARLMDERRVKRLPVVKDGKLVGIVARSDLIRALASVTPARAPFVPDDLAIKDRFEATAREAGFSSVGSVTVDVRSGRVHLWGIAETKTERKALEVAAAEIPGVQGVENHLAVREGFIEAL